jgi:Cd2+/Zn2+-exporting ATPase
VLSVPLGYFAGLGAASSKGILIKGGSYLDLLSRVDTAVFDKTGTLTKGVFEVTKSIPEPQITSQELLYKAAMAEAASLAVSIVKAYGKNISAADGGVTDLAGLGTIATIDGKRIIVGNERLMSQENIAFTKPNENGTIVYVAEADKYLGCIVISDVVKDDSALAIKRLKESGVTKTVMLTGDVNSAAKAIAESLGIDEYRAELLPAGKVTAVESLIGSKTTKGSLIFVGDGINDAPVLARADVGIAMGGIGSDAAVEAADVVIMSDEPSKIAEGIKIARITRRVVMQNIVFALSIKFIVLALSAFGFAAMWAAVFADVGVALLAVANSMRILIIKIR